MKAHCSVMHSIVPFDLRGAGLGHEQLGHRTVMHRHFAYHKDNVMVGFFGDKAILVTTIFALVNPFPALCISCKSYTSYQQSWVATRLACCLSKRLIDSIP